MAKKLSGVPIDVNPGEDVYLLKLGRPANVVRVAPSNNSRDMITLNFLVDGGTRIYLEKYVPTVLSQNLKRGECVTPEMIDEIDHRYQARRSSQSSPK